MLNSYNYSGLNQQGKEFKIAVDIHETPGFEKDPDFDLMIRGIVADALKFTTQVKSGSVLHIEVTGFDKENANFEYKIVEQRENPTHQIAFKQLKLDGQVPAAEKKKSIEEIIACHVVPLGAEQKVETVNSKSLIERFSAFKKSPLNIFDKAKNILASFFAKILYRFQLLEKIWFALTQQTAKDVDPVARQLKWDLNLLAEICGTLPTGGMTMYQSLQYMSKTLQREREDVSDSVLKVRINAATEVAKKITDIQKSYSAGDAKTLIQKMQKGISKLTGDTKILFPVGYFKNKQLFEALIEVSKDASGKYRVVLISVDEETRDLFDREVGLQTGSQSIRREITNINEAELLAAIPTLIELQTTPACLQDNASAWQNLFLQALRFDQSQVEVSPVVEPYRIGQSPGNLSEVISYVKAENKTADESNRFELAIRLRLFLDVCKSNENGLKDPDFWKSVKTTALHMAALIEQNKALVGPADAQGVELTRIYGELKELLDKLERTPPDLIDLRAKNLSLFSGTVEVKAHKATPKLQPIKMEPHVYPKIEPALAGFDPANPAESMKKWGMRCRAMMSQGKTEDAAYEAKLMTQMLPAINSAYWNKFTLQENLALLTSFNNMGEAIARGAVEKTPAPLQDISAIAILNLYVCNLTLRIGELAPDQAPMETIFPFITSMRGVKEDLAKCNLIPKERETLDQLLQSIFAKVAAKFGDSSPHFIKVKSGTAPFYYPITLQHSSIYQTLLSMNQFTAMTLGLGSGLSAGVNEGLPLKFKLDIDGPASITTLEGNSTWKSSASFKLDPPLVLRAPAYAFDVTKEITNRYVTEYCCLGCISDNCPNYAQVAFQRQRFNPLYLVHNFVDHYCDQLTRRGQLHRDELTDLLYTQQTNQNARDLYVAESRNGMADGFDVPHHFNVDDRCTQFINTFMVYLEHPHFFKQPDLRWLFENKIFTNNILAEMLSPATISERKPLFCSLISKLKKEITIANAAGDKEIAGYLLNICEEIKDGIEAASISDADKKTLLALLPKDGYAILNKWTEELIGKNDEHLLTSQLMLFPLILQNYYKKFTRNNNDPCFDMPRDVEMILCAAARIESSEKMKKNIDPEVYDRCQTIKSLVISKARKIVDAESEATKGDFVNKILFRTHPIVAALRLPWNSVDFPTFLARDTAGKIYQFDLTNGKITFESRTTDELPDNIKHLGAVERIFGKAINDNWNMLGTPPESGEKIIAYTHKDFPDYRIVVKRDPKALTSGKPDILIERTITKPNGNKEVVMHADFDTLNRLREKGLMSDSPDLPIAMGVAIGDRTCWVDQAKKMIYIYDKDSDLLFGTMQVETGLLSKETRITDLHIRKDDVHLLSAGSKELEKFTSIEDPRFIEVLGKKGKAKTINYQRYEMSATGAPLLYEIDNKGIISSNSFPNYRLAVPGVRPGSTNPAIGVVPLPTSFESFQLLQKDGDEKVLIPLRELAQQFAATGISLPMSETIYPDKLEKCQIFEYAVDRDTNRLTAKSGDAYAYLAYTCLAHWDYESAAYYLSKASTTAGYGANYEKVFEYFKNWTDDTPNGIAMKLRFNLFQEKVLQDVQIRQIREGGLKNAEAVAIMRAPRLIEIAKLYEEYTGLLQSRKAGEIGLDIALDLDLEDEQSAKKLIKSLLSTHGNQQVNSDEPTPIRAAEIPLQAFLTTDTKDNMGISKGTVLLWAVNGTERDKTRFTVKNPLWIVQNFRHLFNQILAEDVTSIQYKQIKHQIRMMSELPKDALNPVQKESVNKAQAYLMKLMTAKEKQLSEYTDLQTELGKKNKLGSFDGAIFNFMRANEVEKMDLVLEKFDEFTLALSTRARKQAELIIANITQAKRDKEKNVDPHDLFGLSKKILKFIAKWDKTNPQPPFEENFKNFLMNEIYGSKGTKSLKALDKVLDILKPVGIAQQAQAMAPKTYVQKTSETFTERFGKLLQSAAPQYESSIKELESLIDARPTPVKPDLVVTEPSRIRAVMGDTVSAEFVNAYFTVTQQPTPKINQKLFDELGQSEEKAYVRVAERHRADLNAYLNVPKTNATIIKSAAKRLKENLISVRDKLTKQEEALKKELLESVELFNTPAGISAMRRLVGKGVKPSLDFIIALWRRGETANEWSDHPFNKLGMKKISEQNLKLLDANIAKYLELSTTHNHLNRVIDASTNYLNSCKENDPSSLGDAQLANELYEGIQAKRNYSVNDSDFRDLLYVEYTQKIIMYADQIGTLREMVFDPNAVRQLRMGRGKTEVIMPILAKKKATGKNLVMLMLPEELYEANCHGLDIKNRVLFGQEMHRFEFGRKTNKSVEALEKIHLSLLETIRDKGFVMTTKRSVLSLKDSYVLLLNNLSELKPHQDKTELLAQVRAMSKIYSLFANQGEVLADEVDACLDVRKEVNFALGETEIVDQVKGDVAAELMELVLDQKPSDALYDLKTALLSNTQAAFSPEKRVGMVKKLVDIYIEKHRDKLAGVDKEQFGKYIMNDPSSIEAMKWVVGLKETNNDLYKQLTTLKALISQGFGTTLGRVGNVNYGRDPTSGTNTIPYKASNTPSIGSEFDDDIERISFTYQDYLQNGVTYKQIYQIVARMQNRALAEMRNSPSDEFINILDMQAAKEFQDFIKKIDSDKKLPSGLNLSSMCDPKMIQTLVETINDSPMSRLNFCHTQVVGKMQQYGAQINAVSTETPQLVENFGGFTGTPWNIHTYHDKINAEASLGVDGSTWALMLGREVLVKTFNFDAANPIESLLSNINMVGNSQALVDTGAYLRGTNNVDFIDKVLDIADKEQKPVEAGIYFDEAGRIVKKQKVDDKALPIEIAPATDLMHNVTLYDQAHTVGADIKQGKKAIANVTIGENTFIRDLFQAVWRLRQLHLEQSVVLALSSEIKTRILEGNDRKFGPDDIRAFCDEIHKFCLMNETRREAEDNFKAEKEMIQGFAKRQLLPTIATVINDEASDEVIIKMAEKFASTDAGLFIKKRPKEEAYDQYACLKTLEAPTDVFKRLRKKETEKSQEIANVFSELGLKTAASQFEKISVTISERKDPPGDWFLNKVDSNQAAGGEVEQEAQAEVEQEMELLVQTETQTQTEVAKEVSIPIVQSGAAGSGNVVPLTVAAITQLAATGNNSDTSSFRNLAGNIPFFDQNVICSAVYERNLPVNSLSPVSPQSIFYSNRKPVKQVLISKNNSGAWTMLIPTIHEAHKACREFITPPPAAAKPPLLFSGQAALMGISTGKPLLVYKTGKDRTDALPFTTSVDQEEFYKLYVQAKLFNGEIEFSTKEEQYALKKWLLSKGSNEFKRYFEENILAAKPRRFADSYPTSTLFKIFTELADTSKMAIEDIDKQYPPLEVVIPIPAVVPAVSTAVEPPKVPVQTNVADKPVEPSTNMPTLEPIVVTAPQTTEVGADTTQQIGPNGFDTVADFNFAVLQILQSTKQVTMATLIQINMLLEDNQNMIKSSKLKDRLEFVEMIKQIEVAIDSNAVAIGTLSESLKTMLVKKAGHCVSNEKDLSNWRAEVLKFNRIDNRVASAIIFDLLEQSAELKGLNLEAWPLVVEWRKNEGG